MIVLCFLLWGYICIYPPTIVPIFLDPSTRVIYESIVLLTIVLYSRLRDTLKIPKDLLWLIVLVALYWIFSQEESKQVLSFFNKYVFLIFLISVIRHSRSLFIWLRGTWIAVWFVMPVLAVLACLIFALNLAPYSAFRFGNYEYFNYPLLGLVLHKHFGSYILPRYSSWFVEPGYLSFFFGANIFMARYLLFRVNWRRWFIGFNLVGGLLTFSVTFYIFFDG